MAFLISCIGAVLCSIIITFISYSESIKDSPLKAYIYVILASAIAGITWCQLARSTKHEDLFTINLIWDVGMTILYVLMPVIFFNIKLDFKAILGTVICIIGLLLVKLGEAK
jgi:uncharacterized membrane protein